jgi:polyketide synthase 12
MASEVALALAQRLRALTAEQQQDLVQELVCSNAAVVLGHPNADGIDPHQAFQDLGFDSLTGVVLSGRLKNVAGIALPPTVVFDHPTPAAVAGYLVERLSALVAADEAAAAPVTIETPVAVDTPTANVEDAVAIVGMGCRYPGGVTTPEALWDLVMAGRDVVSEFPRDRGWDVDELFNPDPDAAGKSYTRSGGFLYDAGDFDAGFFGIGPREALATDPQQRLLLETAWEALEQAGIDPVSLRGSATGVFVGIMNPDYGLGQHDSAEVEGYRLTGLATSVASGRVAYALGLEGPAVSVDTACSSSLVALHWAAQSLRSGECDLALAGGVTVMATPTAFVEFSRQRGLAPDGRCKAFASAADGVGWAEGVGVLAVERLADAQRLGHPVLAVIGGSAVNQDGASNGLTAPNGPSQQRVIKTALANAGLTPADVDVVEAHGTGTVLGDPIEAQALLATYGQNRLAGRPLWLGSVKSNIGHTSAAAGVAGVIKMVQAIRHAVMPATLHVDAPTPHVDWSAGSVSLLTKARNWDGDGRPRRAGISSFGISGTNAHVILEQAPNPPDRSDHVGEEGLSPLPVVPWVVSGKSKQALASQAARLSEFLAKSSEADPVDVGWSLAATRSAFEHRSVILGADRDQLMAGLNALAHDQPDPSVVNGRATSTGKTVFVFPGQGAQRLGMGRQLHAEFPVFAESFDEVADELDRHLRIPLRQVIWGDDEALVASTEFAQPALFAVETALCELLRHWGVRPDFVMGHSVGELTAAYVAQVLSLADAAALVAARGRLMQALPQGGVMTAVAASQEEVLPLLVDGVTIAAVNAPGSVVLSGEEAGVTAVADALASKGRRIHQLAVSHAFHSPLMEPMLDEFVRIASDATVGEAQIPVVSNVTGQLAGPGYGSAQYWADHVRRPVRFADSVQLLESLGANRFVEAGPGAGLSVAIEGSLSTAAAVVPALGKELAESTALVAAVGRLFTAGVGVDWSAVFAGRDARIVQLPTYAFQRQRFWLQSKSSDSGVVGPESVTPKPKASEHAPPASPDSGDASDPSRLALAQSLQGLTDDQQRDLLEELVRSQVAAVLGRSADDVDPHKPFQELGLQSLSAVELRNRLNAATGLDLAPTLIFEYPTPAALANLFAAKLGGAGASNSALEDALDDFEGMLPSIDASDRRAVASRLRRLLEIVDDDS